MTFIRDLRALFSHREVLTNLVQADLKLRYRRSILGYSWSLLYPLLTMAIMALVFSRVMRFDTNDYVLYVFAGLLPWNFLLNALWGAGISLLTHETLLKKIYLPKVIFPVSVTLARFLDFLFNLAALFVVVSFVTFRPSMALLALPAAALLLFLFTTGVALAMSALNVYIRDTTHLVAVVMQLGFYLTPIIYPEDVVPPSFRMILEINPVTHLVRLFQRILWKAEFPTPDQWLLAVAVTVSALMIGHLIFAALERRLVFRL